MQKTLKYIKLSECFPARYSDYVSRIFKSSRPEMFCKKGILRNSTEFTGKHLCRSLFFNKVEGLRLLLSFNFIKKETLAKVFSRELCEISGNIFS